MNRVTQHIPNFCDGFEPERRDFETTDELRGVPFVERWSELSGFHRYSQSVHQRGAKKQICLMAEVDAGAVWYVIGYLDEEADLPVFVPKRGV